jgi:hypothetical protein
MATDGCEVLNDPGRFGAIVLWLKADDGPEADPTGGRIRVWRDRSGRNNDLAQGAPMTQPVLRPMDIAGRPAVVFDGLDDVLINAAPSGSFASGISVFAVVKPTNSPPDAVMFAADIPGCSTPSFGFQGGMNSYLWRGRYVIGMGGVVVGEQQSLATVVAPSGEVTLWRNGNTVTSGGTDGCGNVNSTKFALGADTRSPPRNYSPMSLGELLVYGAPVTPDNVRALDGYLRARWAIP